MENLMIIILAIVFFIVLIVSLYFLFKKKEVVVEEELVLMNVSSEIDNEIEKEVEEIKIIPELEKTVDLILDEPQKIENESVLGELEKELIKNVDEPKLDKDVNVNNEKIGEDEKLKLSINISSKTEKVLLKKIADFENSRGFLNKEVNLNFLAKEFNTNTKYLSEIIKSYKNKNFNQYLNELRIDDLIEQLNTNEKVLNTKVSFLASDFGFNSHSSFSTIFTQYVGKSPSEYIKELKQNKLIK